MNTRPQERAAAGVYLRVAARSDVGRVRVANEDAYAVLDLSARAVADPAYARVEVGGGGVLLAVADGMGGADAGDVASALVVETLGRLLAETPPGTPPDVALERAVQRTHRVVWDAGVRAGQRGHRRMGATLTAVLVQRDPDSAGGVAWFAEVGDSRAYVVRDGRIKQLTHDQSMVQVLVDAGVMPPENIDASPFRNVILQAMGHQEQLDVAIGRLHLRWHDCLLLCSDGLTSCVSATEIEQTIVQAPRLDAAADRLVALANERGGEDNVTVVIAGVGGAVELAKPDEAIEDTVDVMHEWQPKMPARGGR